MEPKLIFDAHLDLSWNALGFNRDLRLPLEEIRRREHGQEEKSSGRNTVCFPEMRHGQVGLCVATQLARCEPDESWKPTLVSRLRGHYSQEQAWAATQGQLAWYREMEADGELVQIRNRSQLDDHLRLWNDPRLDGKSRAPIGYILSLENADSIVSLKHLEVSYAAGLRALGPVHYGPGIYGHGTYSEGPMTIRGRELLKEMERLGIILDVTHLCDEGFTDALRIFNGPVWASHSNCRAIANWSRQLNDDQIKELIRRQAVIGVAFDAVMMVDGWIRGKSQPGEFGLRISKICDHIDHICQLAGNANHVGIGSDLDGGFGTEQTPLDLDSIADVAKVGALLAGRGYREVEIEGILHGNFISFLRRNWPR